MREKEKFTPIPNAPVVIKTIHDKCDKEPEPVETVLVKTTRNARKRQTRRKAPRRRYSIVEVQAIGRQLRELKIAEKLAYAALEAVLGTGAGQQVVDALLGQYRAAQLARIAVEKVLEQVKFG